MKQNLSLIMITKNAEEVLEQSLRSVRSLVDEIIIVDNHSIDNTVAIADQFDADVYLNKEDNLGKQKLFTLKRATGEWILSLDADEVISPKLKEEIKKVLSSLPRVSGYRIPFQNHFLGRQISHGGEKYIMMRLFRKDSATINSALVHEHFVLTKGRIDTLKNPILHFSYRSLLQMYKKFTDYSIREARQKVQSGEKTSLKKIFLYPLHMFWARFIKDKGYKDGLFRIPLDLGFAYMEWLTYAVMLFMK